MRHAKSDAARGAAAQALLDRGYGKSVAVALDVVDDGQAHLEALRELSRWDNGPEQKGLVCIAGKRTRRKRRSPPWLAALSFSGAFLAEAFRADLTEDDAPRNWRCDLNSPFFQMDSLIDALISRLYF